MKKIFSMAAITLFMAMTSCSGDDDVNTETVLLTKTIETDDYGNETTTNYTYDGNKIVSIIEVGGMRKDFTYTGDLITQIDYSYEGDSYYNQKDILEYNSNNQLISLVELYYGTNSFAGKYLYTYNDNGTVTENRFAGELESQTAPAGSSIITVNNGNVISYEDYVWAYDDKHNPWSDVLGWNALNIAYKRGINNVTGLTDSGDILFTNSYTYGDNHPITSVFLSGGNSDGYSITTQYFYEKINPNQ